MTRLGLKARLPALQELRFDTRDLKRHLSRLDEHHILLTPIHRWKCYPGCELFQVFVCMRTYYLNI
ncbi:hypothetical protein RSAG8_00375, partial [Rhizoctonia solani AG-8 WAC10335]